MDNRRVHLVVTGRVQGVGFRYATTLRAQALGVVGTVRNRTDGAVEVVAEGRQGPLQELVDWCHDGPSLARVDHVDVQWQAPTFDYVSFAVVP